MRTDKLSYKVIWLQVWHFYHVPMQLSLRFIFWKRKLGEQRLEINYREKSFLITSHCKCPSMWSQRFTLLCKMRSTEFLFRAIFWIWIGSLSRYRFWACIVSGSTLTNDTNFSSRATSFHGFSLEGGRGGKKPSLPPSREKPWERGWLQSTKTCAGQWSRELE